MARRHLQAEHPSDVRRRGQDALGIAVLGTVLSAWAATGTFTEAVQGTAMVAAVLLAVASFVAYRLIPNGEPTPRPAVRADAP